jgi:hypothetical protein
MRVSRFSVARAFARVVLARLPFVAAVGLVVRLHLLPRVLGRRAGRQLPRLLLLGNACELFPGEVKLELSELAEVEECLACQDVEDTTPLVAESEIFEENVCLRPILWPLMFFPFLALHGCLLAKFLCRFILRMFMNV